MTHPLVELASKEFYLKSHINADLIQRTNKTDLTEFELVEANKLLRRLQEYPHAFVLACLMDTVMDANKAWAIPYKISKILNTFDITDLYHIKLGKYISMFCDNKLHRYSNTNAEKFYYAVHRIVEHKNMQGDASKIWNDKPSSQDVVMRFLEFKGCGFKIANMAPNLLWRYYGIKFSDYLNFDIAPDVHVIRVFKRLGLVPHIQDEQAAKIYTICKARELNPEMPGMLDGICWTVGQKYCNSRKPNCVECPFNLFCKKQIKPSVHW